MTLLTGFLLVVIVALLVAGLFFFYRWQTASTKAVVQAPGGAPVITPEMRRTLLDSSPTLARFRDQISIEGGLS